MKIIILSDSYATDGGAARIARIMAQGFKRMGHDILIVTSTQNRMSAGLKDIDGIQVQEIYTDYNLFWRAYRGLYNPQTIEPLKKIIHDFKPDIVQAHNIHSYLSYHALKIAKKSKAKVFLTAHDAMLFHYGKLVEFINPHDLSCPEKFDYKISAWKQLKRYGKTYNPLRNIIIRYYLKYADKIFAVSDALKEALNQNGIANVSVIHNGIDADEWQLEKNNAEEFKNKYSLAGKKTILFGGRLSETKGGREIVLAMGEVVKKVPDANLLVLGKIDGYAGQMIDLSVKLGIKDKLVFTGWLSGDELKAAFNSADIITAPSICFDSFPTVNLEAMACRKPVIATCFGGSKEAVLDGQTGYIVNPYNIDNLASKIVDLLQNPEKAKTFGETGYERVKSEFNIDRMLSDYLIFYE